MLETEIRDDNLRESLSRWLLALLASVVLASILLLELARMRG